MPGGKSSAAIASARPSSASPWSQWTSRSPGEVELDLLLGAVDLEEDVDGAAGGDPWQRGGDRGDDADVAGEQVPVGARVGRVAAAGAAQLDRVAGRGGRGPGSGDPLVAVDDEVDRQQAALGVPLAHGVGADLRPLVLRRALARELELHVVVGELAELEPGQPVAAEDDPASASGSAARPLSTRPVSSGRLRARAFSACVGGEMRAPTYLALGGRGPGSSACRASPVCCEDRLGQERPELLRGGRVPCPRPASAARRGRARRSARRRSGAISVSSRPWMTRVGTARARRPSAREPVASIAASWRPTPSG